MNYTINNSDKTLVVSSIKELGRGRSFDRSRLNLASFAISQKNLDPVKQAISEITNDNMVSPIEKQTFKGLYDMAYSEHSRMAKEHDDYKILDGWTTAFDVLFNNVVTAFNNLTEMVTPILANMSEASSVNGTEVLNTFNAYYNKAAEYTEALTTFLTEGIYIYGTKTKIFLRIISSSGIALDSDGFSTLSAKVYVNGDEDTNNEYQGTYVWHRVEDGWHREGDVKTSDITIGVSDLYNNEKATFRCVFTYTDDRDNKFKTIDTYTIEKTVKGNDGSYTEYQFALSSSPLVAPSEESEWQDGPQETTEDKPYSWMRERRVTFSNNVATEGEWGYIRLSGPQGPTGPSGTSNYTHIRYSEFSNGKNAQGVASFQPTPSDDRPYMGIYTGNNASAPADADLYTWSQYRGNDGVAENGWSQATISLYKRSVEQPAYDGGNLTYTFSTGAIEGNLGTWSKTITSSDEPLWVIYGSALSNSTTDSITTGEWTTPTILSENGTNGQDGMTVYTVILYQRDDNAPELPIQEATYNFENHTITGVGSWTLTVPADNGKPVWVTNAVAASRGAAVIATDDWATPQILVQDGKDGKPSYFHIRYSPVANPNASQMTETPSEYIGTYTDDVQDDSDDPSKYTWARFKGETGIAIDGKDGKTSYLHIKYSDDGVHFTDNEGEDIGIYIGTYTDFTEKDSDKFSDYRWSRFKGEQGLTGNGIGNIEYFYKRTDKPDKPDPNTITESTMMSTTPTEKYLWQKQVIDFTSEEMQDKVTVSLIAVHGETGESGNGIVSITYKYATSTEPVKPEDNDFSAVEPTVDNVNKYLWQQETIEYTKATAKVTTLLIGVYGDSAPNLQAQYSEDATNWHDEATDDDMYARFSADGGITWGNAVKVKGEDGKNGKDSLSVNRNFSGSYGVDDIVTLAVSEFNRTPSVNDMFSNFCNGNSAFCTWKVTAINGNIVTCICISSNVIKGPKGDNSQDYSLNISPATFNTLSDYRGYYVKEAQTIYCVCKLNNISGVTPSWTIQSGANGRASINANTGELKITVGKWTTTPTSKPQIVVRCTVQGFGFKEYTINSVPAGGDKPVYARAAKTRDLAIATIEADYGVWTENDYFLDTNGVPKRIGATEEVELASTDSFYAEACSTMAVDVFNTIPDESVVEASWGWIKNLVCNSATITEIFSSVLTMRDEGVIKSENYAESTDGKKLPTKGYKLIGVDGIIKAQNMVATDLRAYGATMNNVNIDGDDSSFQCSTFAISKANEASVTINFNYTSLENMYCIYDPNFVPKYAGPSTYKGLIDRVRNEVLEFGEVSGDDTMINASSSNFRSTYRGKPIDRVRVENGTPRNANSKLIADILPLLWNRYDLYIHWSSGEPYKYYERSSIPTIIHLEASGWLDVANTDQRDMYNSGKYLKSTDLENLNLPLGFAMKIADGTVTFGVSPDAKVYNANNNSYIIYTGNVLRVFNGENANELIAESRVETEFSFVNVKVEASKDGIRTKNIVLYDGGSYDIGTSEAKFNNIWANNVHGAVFN